MKLLEKKFVVFIFSVLAIVFFALSLISIGKVEAMEVNTPVLLSFGKSEKVIDSEMEKQFTQLYMIPNSNYFKTNPRHALNTTDDCPDGTCTTVAFQLLMGYHNYYTDRRLIPATDENGENFLSADYADLTKHPEMDISVSKDDKGLGRKATGTDDNFFKKLMELNSLSANRGGQMYPFVIDGVDAFIKQYSLISRLSVGIDFDSFKEEEVNEQLFMGNPVIVGRGQIDEQNFHVMVAYGRARYNGEDGYIVHCGWYNDRAYAWVPKSLLCFQVKMTVNHNHEFVESERFVNSCFKEYVCTTCGANTFNSTLIIEDNAITGLKEPFGKTDVNIPDRVTSGLPYGQVKTTEITKIKNNAFKNSMSADAAYNVYISNGIKTIEADSFSGCSSLKSVVFGSGLENIGQRAFKDCSSLELVLIGENIQRIEDSAFENCSSLTEMLLGSKVNYIGGTAFRGCSSLLRIDFGENAEYIGAEALKGCVNLQHITFSNNFADFDVEDYLEFINLESITVSSDNSVYSSVNGLLYSKDKKTLLLCPAAYSTKVFPVDSACEEIASYAFANNPNIQTLNLVNTKIIHSNSILNCSSLANIIAPKLEVAFSSAITGTKFTNERADITLGTVLLKKTSAGEIVEIADDVKTIAPDAFVGNESVKKLVVKNHSFREIGDNAFKDCSTLENVEIYNLNEVVRLGTGAFDGVSANLKIKVPQKYLNSYKTETTKGWTSFANNLTTFDKLSVKYVVGDKVVKESFVDYGNEIGEDYKYIDGDYYAKTWKTADGTEIKGYYMVTEDIVLYGKLEPYNFTITYVTNGGKPITQGKYNVENDQKLIEAKRTGYTFEGWYTSPDLAEESKIDLVIKKGTRTGNLTVYAKWSVNTYTVAFDPGVDMSAITAQDVVFDEPFTFITISSSGRIFNGWKDENGRLLTNANGIGLGKWDIGESTTVYADWILIEYTITYPNADLPGNPDKFTIEDLPLVLVLTTDSQARNDGWYLNPEFTGVKVTEINEIGDITLYAKWAYCYNISYQVLGGRFKDGVYPSCSFAYYGDSFILPTIWREGFIDGVWTYKGREYAFGYNFTVKENEKQNDGIEFVVKWNPCYYKITFDFRGGTNGKYSTATREIMAAYYEIVPEIVLPVKAGYNFVGYVSTGNKLYYEVKNEKVIRKTYDYVGNMTLSACWEVAYPKLTIDGKNGSTWSIRIQNTSSAKVTFDYNSKMLFEKDAKVWNVSDKDKKSVEIESKQSAVVYISENWFATCIVVSMQLDDKRYITYAYNLNTDGTITCVNCYV